MPESPSAHNGACAAGSTESALASEKEKTSKVWDELVRVGKSWEAQAAYIRNLEAERARLQQELGEVRAAWRELIAEYLRVIDQVASGQPGAAVTTASERPSRMEVALGYLIFLGRLPESVEVVERLWQSATSRQKLLEAFLRSPEASLRFPGLLPYEFTGTEDPMRVEEVKSAATMKRFFENTGRVWTQLGQSEPHWSVLTDERFKAGSIDEQQGQFYASGAWDISRFLATLKRCQVDLGSLRDCLDFGCGVGRLTNALAPHFEKVFGVDISPAHLQVAQSALSRFGVANVQWIHLASLEDLGELPRVDALVSLIVLQHNPPPVALHILRALLSLLRPGGVAWFQIPTHFNGYEFRAEPYLKQAAEQVEMEMHPIPQARLFQLFADAEMEVLEVVSDGCCKGIAGVSNTFLLRRKKGR